MSTFDKKMNEIFDVVPKEDIVKSTEIIHQPTQLPSISNGIEPDLKNDLNDDYYKSRDNIQQLIDTGKEAMHDLLQIARDSQHPRAFEVFATLMKNVGELNDKLLDSQKKMRTMDGKSSGQTSTKIDKAIFVGSTADLNKLLKGKLDEQ
jgi:Terminase DNA packaging enzyme